MNKCLLTAFALLLTIVGSSQSGKPAFNQKLADSLHADDYGMKMYMLVILKSGTNKTESKEITDSLFRGHMDNIVRLVNNKKMIVAGPLGKNDKEYRGIFILDAATKEEANALLLTDPAIQSKLLDAELYPWYGSAALPKYLPYHDMIQKKSY